MAVIVRRCCVCEGFMSWIDAWKWFLNRDVKISDGYCNACYKRELKKLDKYRNGKD